MEDPLSTSAWGDDPQPWAIDTASTAEPTPSVSDVDSTPSATASIPPSPSPHDLQRADGDSIYGREPRIYGQPEPGLVSSQTMVGANGTKFEKREPYLRVRITSLDRNRRDILFKFDAQTNLSNFTGTTYRNISRTYIEFQQFYEALINNCPHTIIPALPLAQTSAPTDEEDDRLVKIMLQRWLSRICEDPIIMHDEDLRSFVESDFGYQPTPRPRRKGGSGFTLIRRGVADEDEELQRARFELTKLETQFYDAAKAIDKLASARKAIALAHAEMGNKLVNVATTESHPPLANAVRKLGRTWHSLADLDQAQALSECVVIGDTLGYQGMNARSAKETLQQRNGVLEEYQAAAKSAISKRKNIERLKASSTIRPERVDEALEDLEEANRYEQTLARRADGISQNLHRALDRHQKIVTDDVTAALVEHARSSIMYERQLLRELEALRTDVNNANKKVEPAKLNGAPKPLYVPPLEDDFKPNPAPPPPKQPSTPSFHQNQTYFRPNGTLPPQSPGAGPSTPSFAPRTFAPQGAASIVSGTSRTFSPQIAAFPSPAPSRTFSPQLSAAPVPASVPSNAPSTPNAVPAPASSGPPLGGRFVNGTQSMFVQPQQPPAAPSAASYSTSALPPQQPPVGPLGGVVQSSSASNVSSPLTSPSPSAAPHPLAAGGPLAHSVAGLPSSSLQPALDPLGGLSPANMTQSMRVTPSRPRLDARLAARQLGNMF